MFPATHFNLETRQLSQHLLGLRRNFFFSSLSVLSRRCMNQSGEIMSRGSTALLLAAACLILPTNIGAYLLVVGGDIGSKATDSVEVVEISPGVDDSDCSNKTTGNFPQSLIGAAGGLLGEC